MVIKLLPLLFFLSPFSVKAQQITIGQQSPDALLANIVNYPVKQAKISDFRGKLLILDFWATWCSPCVAMLPKTDSLQKQFEGKIQIMPVTAQDEKTVGSFLEKLHRNKKILLPSVTGDTTLRELFAFKYVPHYVWINGNGTVVAITDNDQVTAENIQVMLGEKNKTLPVKKDAIRPIDMAKAVFELGNPIKNGNEVSIEGVNRKDVRYYSVITQYIDGLLNYADQSDSTRISAINFSPSRLYSLAFGRFSLEFFSRNRFIVEAKDTSRFFTPAYAQKGHEFISWLKDGNGYCYELQVPPSLVYRKFEIMQEELNRYFGALYGIEGKMEKRKQKVFALVRTSGKDKLATKGGDYKSDESLFFLNLQNSSLSNFVDRLKNKYMQFSPLPLVEETNYTGMVDMEINARLSDMHALNKELEKYDLKFVERVREIDMIVIRDKK